MSKKYHPHPEDAAPNIVPATELTGIQPAPPNPPEKINPR